MYFGYTDTWGSGKSWGGDLDGYNNELEVRQNVLSQVVMIMILVYMYGVIIATKLFLVKDMKSTTHLHLLGIMTERAQGNYVRLDIHGDYNDFKGSQEQDSFTIS